MAEQLNADVKLWLGKAVRWQNDGSLAGLVAQQQHQEELTKFLLRMRTHLLQLGSVDRSLAVAPQVGQLLGRLCSLPILLCDESCYMAMMRCIMFFYTESPRTPIQTRAKQWVILQLQNTWHHNAKQQLGKDSCLNMPKQQNFHQHCLEELTKLIRVTLAKSLRLWDNRLNCYIPQPSCAVSQKLLNSCRLCLGLRHVPKFAQCLDEILGFVSTCNQTDQITELYREMTHLQQSCFAANGGTVLIPYKSQLALWCCYLPSLELAVLGVVEACMKMPYLCRTRVIKLIHNSQLDKGCAECGQVYKTVFDILRSIHVTSHTNYVSSSLIGWLHDEVTYCKQNSEKQRLFPLLSFCGRSLRSTVSLLQIKPRDLSQSSCENHLRLISKRLENLADEPDVSIEQIEWTLLQFTAWYYEAMLLSMIGTKESFQAYVRVLRYYRWFRDKSAEREAALEEALIGLRGLISKKQLTPTDVQCAVRINQNALRILRPLIGHLICIFILLCESALQIYEAIFQLVLCSDKRVQLHCLLETLQKVQDHLPVWSLTFLKTESISSVLDSLLQHGSQNNTPDGVSYRTLQEWAADLMTSLKS